MTEVLGLADAALADGRACGSADVERIGVGVGPGSFTGLRIGIATARALAHGAGLALAPVSTLGALAVVAGDGPVLAVLDARRGEAFVTRWEAGAEVLAPRAVGPGELGAAGRRRRRWRWATAQYASGPSSNPRARRSPRTHRRSTGSAPHGLARLAAGARVVDRDALLPDYVRAPDAKPRSEQ